MNYLHKDSEPIKTIYNIRELLDKVGIHPIETSWIKNDRELFSNRINLPDLNVGSNGKGTSAENCLASAYGEFMERLQNNFLDIGSYGKKEFSLLHKDYILKNREDLFNDNQNIIGKELIDNILKNEIYAAPFYNVFNRSIIYLPIEILKIYTGTNGMCAGNTPFEAIVQGICEIFERHVLYTIYKDNLTLPTISLDDLKNYKVYNIIERLRKRGYSIIVKDCTLKGKFPVLAVVMFNQNYSKHLISFGSDPDFEVALLRCLTELLQGVDESVLEKYRMLPIDLSWNSQMELSYCDYINHENFIFPDKLDYKKSQVLSNLTFSVSEETKEYRAAFENKYKNTKNSLKHILSILKSLSFDVYVRDVSIFGFPSYYIYVPQLSINYTRDECFIRVKAKSSIRKVFLNIYNADNTSIQECIINIERLLEIPYLKFLYNIENKNNLLQELSGLIFKESTELFTLDINLFLALLSYKIFDYKRAFKYMNNYLKKIEKGYAEPVDDEKYYKCILYYLKLKSELMDTGKIRHELSNIFEALTVDEVIEDMKNPTEIFKYLVLPQCNDCDNCLLNNICIHKEWEIFTSNLSSKMRRINQNSLEEIFQ